MTNTINNVPRELLERVIMSTYMYWPDAPLIKEIRALLSAPSPAGVDGLSVVAYRVSLPGEPELGTWLDEDAENEPQMCLHEPLCRLSDAQAIIDGLRGEVGAQRVKTCTALKDRNDARKERDAALAECERLRMQLAACGVVALANTIESAGEARQMHPDYMSASCSDVADAVDREIALRAERDDLRQQLAEARDEISQHSNDLALAYMKGGADMRQQRDKLADILRDLVPGCKWRFMRPRIDAALAEIDHGNE